MHFNHSSFTFNIYFQNQSTFKNLLSKFRYLFLIKSSSFFINKKLSLYKFLVVGLVFRCQLKPRLFWVFAAAAAQKPGSNVIFTKGVGPGQGR